MCYASLAYFRFSFLKMFSIDRTNLGNTARMQEVGRNYKIKVQIQPSQTYGF